MPCDALAMPIVEGELDLESVLDLFASIVIVSLADANRCQALYGVGLLAWVLVARNRECLLVPVARRLKFCPLQIRAGNPGDRVWMRVLSGMLRLFQEFRVQALDFRVLAQLYQDQADAVGDLAGPFSGSRRQIMRPRLQQLPEARRGGTVLLQLLERLDQVVASRAMGAAAIADRQ